MMYGNWDRMMNWGNHPLFGYGFGLVALWSLFWKGLALWKAARNDERYWYIAILLINTAGLLEIAYLLFFAKQKLVLVREAKPLKKSSKK